MLTVCKVPAAVQNIKSNKNIKSLLNTLEVRNDDSELVLTVKKQNDFVQEIIQDKPNKFMLVINAYGAAIQGKYVALQLMKHFIIGHEYDKMPIWLWPQPFQWESWENRNLRVLDGLYSDTIASRLDIFRHVLDKNFHQRNIVIIYDQDPFTSFIQLMHFKPSMVLNVSKTFAPKDSRGPRAKVNKL